MHSACRAMADGEEGITPLPGSPGVGVGGRGYCCRVSGGPLGPELTLSFLPLEGKCVARGIGDLLPPL